MLKNLQYKNSRAQIISQYNFNRLPPSFLSNASVRHNKYIALRRVDVSYYALTSEIIKAITVQT